VTTDAVALPAAGATRAGRSVAALSARLLRRGSVLAPALAAAYMAVEVYSYRRNYPDAASRQRLAEVSDTDALRILQGVPHAVHTAGGFVVWDGGWVIGLSLGVWALLATTRLLRGEEDTGRAELVLAGPVPAPRALITQLLVLAASFAVTGAAAAVALGASGAGWSSSVLYGLGLAGLTAAVSGLAAVAAQVMPSRRRAVGAAATALGLLFLLRTAANSSDRVGGLRWLTPYGWIDELRAFGGDRWLVLLPLLAAPVLLGGGAVALRDRRDAGAGLVGGSDRHVGHGWLLGSPAAFAWRTTQPVLVGWTAAVAVYTAVLGTLVKTVVDFIAADPTYRRILADFGADLTDVTRGVVALLGGTMGVVFSLYGCWRIGAVRDEEASGRADHLLARPVTRGRWLASHVLLAAVATALLSVLAGVAMWTGAAVTGADLRVTDAVGSMLGPLPAAVFFTGLAVLCFGTIPRLTVALSVGLAVASYLVELLGNALGLPAAVLDLSAFHHLSSVPVERFQLLPTAALGGLGLLAAAAGIAAFRRRDLTGN
jgi:ABC-2 type transport system permease protein